MKPIKEVAAIQNLGVALFHAELEKYIKMFQKKLYDVEVTGLSTCAHEKGIVYSAVIFGRSDNLSENKLR